MDVLHFTWEVNKGKAGVDKGEDNPLARAFRKFLIGGFPFDAFSICLFGGEENDQQEDNNIRWLRVLVHSRGGRILFFPGLSISPDRIQIVRNTNSIPRTSFNFDHASLEIERRRWHFTNHDSGKQVAAGRTPDLGEGRLLWFGMSVSDVSILRDFVRETVIIAPAPRTDSQ